MLGERGGKARGGLGRRMEEEGTGEVGGGKGKGGGKVGYVLGMVCEGDIQCNLPPLPSLTEAVVLFEYEKQQDDELSFKPGEVITDVKQVCMRVCT